MPLWLRQSVDVVVDRSTQLLHPGVGKLDLRLRAADTDDAKVICLRDRCSQQRALADSGFAIHDQHGAFAGPGVAEQLHEPPLFMLTPDERCGAHAGDSDTCGAVQRPEPLGGP